MWKNTFDSFDVWFSHVKRLGYTLHSWYNDSKTNYQNYIWWFYENIKSKLASLCLLFHSDWIIELSFYSGSWEKNNTIIISIILWIFEYSINIYFCQHKYILWIVIFINKFDAFNNQKLLYFMCQSLSQNVTCYDSIIN